MLKKAKEFIEQHKYKLLGGATFALAAYAFFNYYNDQNRIRLSGFFQALNSKQLDEVVVSGDTVYFKSAISDWYHAELGNYPISLLFQDLNLRKSPDLKFSSQNENQLAQILLSLGITAASALLAAYILMPDKFGSIKKHPKIIHNHETLDHFYGSEETKLKLKEVIDFLKNSEKYKKLGGRIRKGILLHGPPGTGKTMLAKSLANQANLPFLHVCASEFEQIFVGVGPKKIREMFQQAKSCPQGCIIFIDELDAIGTRSSVHLPNRETTATINQLLTEMDGFQQNDKIVVIGATNRIELIDKALIRAGRFDVKVQLDLPNQKDRVGIFKMLVEKKRVPNEITLATANKVAEKTEGWSGADFQTLINEGIFKAIRQNSESLKDENILQAFNEMLAK